jgi:hypothetical protein
LTREGALPEKNKSKKEHTKRMKENYVKSIEESLVNLH